MENKNSIYPIRGTKVTSPYPVNLTPAEHRLIFSLQKIFKPENILADCYFPKPDKHPNKTYTPEVVDNAKLLQIDCLAVDQRGIFVFESKDYVGWIYGHGDRVHWTQVSAYGHNKHQFYNPIRQNTSHIDAITAIFGNLVTSHSIIVFGREATLKIIDNVPENCHICTQGNLRSLLNNLPAPHRLLSEQQINDIVAKLQASRINPTTITRETHVAEISHNQ